MTDRDRACRPITPFGSRTWNARSPHSSVVGRVSQTGNSTAPHLHFQLTEQMANDLRPYGVACGGLGGVHAAGADEPDL